MAGSGKSVLEGIGIGTESENQVLINAMLPARNQFQKLQMITDYQPRVVTPMSILGLIRRRFKSKVLNDWQEEYNVCNIPRERKSRLELSEILASVRRPKEEGEL